MNRDLRNAVAFLIGLALSLGAVAWAEQPVPGVSGISSVTPVAGVPTTPYVVGYPIAPWPIRK